MKTEEEFDIFYIDMNRLEEQAAEHTFLLIQHSKDLKNAKTEMARIKSELDLIKADIGHWVVKNPKKYSLPEKINAAMIERVILKHPKQKKALAKFLEAQELVNTLQIYVSAYEHRKRMVSEAVQLHHDQYFAKPYIATSEIKEVVEQLEKKRIRSLSKSNSSKSNDSKKKRTGKKRKRSQ